MFFPRIGVVLIILGFYYYFLSQSYQRTKKWHKRALTYESFPCSRILALSPAIRPTHNYCVVLHPTQPTWLNKMGNAFTHFWGHHHLAESLYSLYFHHVFYGLKHTHKNFAVTMPHQISIFPLWFKYKIQIQWFIS